MKKARTILAVLLAVVMVLSILPASLAEGSKKLDDADLSAAEQSGRRLPSKTEKSDRATSSKLTSMQIDPEAIVTAIVVFDEPALAENFTAEEIRAKKAESVQSRMTNAHDTFFKALPFEAQRMYDYTALLNGMSVKTAYKNLSAMEMMSGVKKVYVANEYNAPVTQQPTQANANYMTGAYSIQNIGLYGDGMVVAVLDTGLNLTHEAFQDYGLVTEPALTEADVEATATTVAGKYISDKVPFSYDYHDNDDDVTDGNGHGTHVSGTITGFALDADGAIKFYGVAPAAQLVFMKIFADDTTADPGTNSGIYMAGLEDAFLLGVDAINMSIGSPGGFVYDEELEQEFGNMYKYLDDAGIIVCISAGNEYSMAHSNANFAGEGYVLADYADYGEVASPSTYAGNVSVASVENLAYPSYVMYYNGEVVTFTDNCDDGEHGWLDNFGASTLEMVDCGFGREGEFPAEVEGKIALVSRGDITFSEKNANAAAAGAIGMILYNNEAGTIGMLIDPYYIPAVSIQQAAGQAILAGLDADNTIEVAEDMVEIENSNAWLMSDFSSWGVTPNLELKPTITAPGGMVYSAVAGASDAYEVYSGTSMASPNACGSFLLLAQYLKEEYPNLSKAQRAELAEDLAESTAELPIDADGYLYSPRKSGSGLLNLENAVTSPVYFVEPIVNLYDDPARTGEYKLRYTLVNLSDEEQTYDLEVIGLYDYPARTQSGTYYNSLTSDYLFDGDGMTVTGETKITVPAKSTKDGKLTLKLDEGIMQAFDTIYPNGNYFEGYVYFVNENVEAGNDSPVSCGPLGDVNLDNRVTAADAAEILRAVVGLAELDPLQMYFADVNLDGSVTAADAAYVLRAVVGLESLACYTPTGQLLNTDIHFTFCGFYGDWKQAPVFDRNWSISEDYLFYLAAEILFYPEYYNAGYMPHDLFTNLESNLALSEINNVYVSDNSLYVNYGDDENPLYTYTGTNPMTFLCGLNYIIQIFGEDVAYDIYQDAWYDSMINYSPLHNAISSFEYGEYDNIDGFVAFPIQLRNARHVVMTVSDALTGEIYCQQDDEWIGKAYLSNGVWGARSYYLWYGVNENEESAGYGEFVPSGTIVNVSFEAMLDYPGAELTEEYTYQLTVDYDSPFITDTKVETNEEGAKLLTVSFADNESGVAFADAYYLDEDGYPVALAYGIGLDAEEFVIDITNLPEGTLVQLDAMDYASNWPEFTLEPTTGKPVYYPNYAVDQILNNPDSLGTALPIYGYVSDVYNGTVYMTYDYPAKPDAFGIAVNFADKSVLENIYPGDEMIVVGELDNYYGCPRLDNAEIAMVIDSWGEGDVYNSDFFYYAIYYPRLYQAYGYDEPVTFEDLCEDPVMYVGGGFYLSDIEVVGVAVAEDNTKVITLSDGIHTIDIVGVADGVGDYTYVGDMLYYGYFVVTNNLGVYELRPLQSGNYEWLMFYSDTY